MVHSSLAVEPSGAPLSNHARRYQAPSQASASSASRSRAARSTQRLANSKSLRSRARTWKRLSASYRKNPSQTLSPPPPSPSPFLPSFPSPFPISRLPPSPNPSCPRFRPLPPFLFTLSPHPQPPPLSLFHL